MGCHPIYFIFKNVLFFIYRTEQNTKEIISLTAWKVSKYGVFSGLYFQIFGLNTEIYSDEEDVIFS